MGKIIEFAHRKAKARGRYAGLVGVIALCGFGAGALVSQLSDAEPLKAAAKSHIMSATVTRYSLCAGPRRFNCVVDGDTLWVNGVKVRVADIDAPEVFSPRCAAEKALGDRATARLLGLINQGPFTMRAWEGRDADKYGRKLRVLMRDGQSLGDVLVSEGLARTWSGRRLPWC
jgi:micrococcal nuclease